MILAAALIVCLVGLVIAGWRIGWGPFARLHASEIKGLPGNSERYGIKSVAPRRESSLQGKTVVFLGSSVTHGSASQGISFVEFLAARYGFTAVKEAVSGTTLVDNGADSYVQRLKKLNLRQAELLICQLSTNDATQKKPLGQVSGSMEKNDFDCATIIGAMEFIIAYAREKWQCPVAFYTNCRYDSPAYAEMVSSLPALQKKWEIGVIDMWNDGSFNAISDKKRKLYMADAIHPTKAGYLKWWLPKMEAFLDDFCKGNQAGSGRKG